MVRQPGDDGVVGRSLAQRSVRHLDGLQERQSMEAEVSESSGKVTLKQSRFFADPEAREEGPPTRWLVPVVLRYRDQAGVHTRRALFGSAEETIDLGAQGQVKWILGNSEARGFYRV